MILGVGYAGLDRIAGAVQPKYAVPANHEIRDDLSTAPEDEALAKAATVLAT